MNLITTNLASNYIMEDPREPKRLSTKVDAKQWVQQYLNFDKTATFSVLDVGCGSGDIANAIANQYPNATVVGIDFSKAKIAFAKNAFQQTQNLAFVLGNAFEMAFKNNTYDLVLSRFLFEYLKEPQQLLKEMQRVCKVGGTIMVQDLDGQMLWHYPKQEALELKINKVTDYLAKQTGFDPFVGRKLYSYFYQEKLSDIKVNISPYHLFPGKIDAKNYKLWELKLDIILPKITEALGSKEKAIKLKQAFLDYLLNEETLTYSNLFTVSGMKI